MLKNYELNNVIMNETIINGIFALSGTMLGGLISYIIARNVKETKTLKT